MTELQRWKQELQTQIEQEGASDVGATFAVAYSLALVAEKLGELGFNNGGPTPDIDEAVALALGFKRD